jgi:hypothetical protein
MYKTINDNAIDSITFSTADFKPFICSQGQPMWKYNLAHNYPDLSPAVLMAATYLWTEPDTEKAKALFAALMVRLKVVREKSRDRILPVLFSDNYVALMPGERRTLRTELENADTRGEQPRVVVEGFNVGKVTAK